MKKTKYFLKGVAIFLAVLFVTQIVPNRFYAAAGALMANAFSAEETPAFPVPVQEEEFAEEPFFDGQAVVLGELEDKRTANTKYFRMSDGSFQALQYPQAVHYEADGTWMEYDNTLRAANEEELETTASDLMVRLSKKTNGKKLVRVKKDGYELSWYYAGAAKQTGEVSCAADDGDPATLERISAEVRYNDIYRDVDLQYILSGNTVKENLILNSRRANGTDAGTNGRKNDFLKQ